MAIYYVNQNAQPTGEHEVHASGCSFMPSNKTNLGEHATCYTAVVAARAYYSKVDGCKHCSKPCHTR